jgi:hypothetical protein
VHCDAAPVGDPPDGAPAHSAARPRIPGGPGASGLDTHPAQRAASALATGQAPPYLLL